MMRWRVVCTLWDTIASFSPSIAFIKVLLPAFGLPNILTKPALNVGLKVKSIIIVFYKSKISKGICFFKFVIINMHLSNKILLKA
jgi:hypothetical protein